MLMALDNGVKGGKWFSLIDKVFRRPTLEGAWQQVRANAGAAGVDGQSIARFEAGADKYLTELAEALEHERYRPQAVRRVEIDKPGGGKRPLGIPTVKDRIVQTAVKRVIEPIFEKAFCPTSYGFRPGRGAKDALREVDALIRAGYTHVVDADLEQFFDRIDQTRLMGRLEEKISDGRMLSLLAGWLEQDIVQDTARWRPTQGTPQGAVISPLLANVYLHPLDALMASLGYRMVRYADDFVILCRTPEEAEAALSRVQAWVAENGLSLHPDKTRLGDCSQQGQGFEFLGYRFECGRRWVRDKSLKSLKDRIRQRTGRSRGVSLERVIADLNPMMRGWFGYFKHARPRIFRYLDGFIRRRLRRFLRQQQGRPSQGRCVNDHRRWPNAFFAEHGLFTLYEAHAAARQSRCGNH
jgi:RNA-directed DNA polymerase